MSGQVISRPEAVHSCSPGWTERYTERSADEMIPAGTYCYPPASSEYPPGAAWQCADCGTVWIVEPRREFAPGVVEFRRERWLERRRRQRAGSPA